jgi:hypothetical protein
MAWRNRAALEVFLGKAEALASLQKAITADPHDQFQELKLAFAPSHCPAYPSQSTANT